MALRVWLPLNGDLENKGIGSLSTPFVVNGTAEWEAGKIGNNLYLNNINTNKPIVNELVDTKKLTCSFWFKIKNNSSITSYKDVINFGVIRTTDDYAADYRLEIISSGTRVSWYGNNVVTDSGGSGTITDIAENTWYHVAFATDGETIWFYKNGVQYSTYSNDTYKGKYKFTGALRLGDVGMYVTLADVRVYDECLSQKQIKEISKGLVAHYKLEGIDANENLILRSDKVTGGGQASGITRTYMDDGTLKVVSTSGNGNYCSVNFAENSNTNVGAKMSVGDTYTISCDVKVEDGTTFPTLFINSGNNYKQLGGVTLKLNTWQRVYYTSTWNDPGTGYGNIALHLGFSGAIGTYYFKNFKLEKGSLTSWIPAPTDTMYKALGYNSILTSDCSGNEYNLTMTGDLTYNEDSPRYESSTKFGGTCADYIYGPIFNFLTSPFTFNCWAYQTSATSPSSGNTGNTLQMIAGQGRDCGLAGFELCSANGYARLYLGTQTNGTYYTINDNTINLLNNWHMITGTFDGTIAKLYVDGILKGTKESPVEPSWDQATGFVIGKMSYYYSNQSTAYFPFAGSVSDVKVYATALSAEDILTMYKTSGIIDNKNNVYAYEFKEE